MASSAGHPTGKSNRPSGQWSARASPRDAASMHNAFRRFAQALSARAGSAWAFAAALALVVAWLVSGPLFGYSDHWQLIINTGTTIVTFLMVFLIQKAQNRAAKGVHLKPAGP